MPVQFPELSDTQLRRVLSVLANSATRHERIEVFYSTENCSHPVKDNDEPRHVRSWDGYACLDLPAGYGCADCEDVECENATAQYWAREDLWGLHTPEEIGFIREDWARAAIVTAEQARGLDTDPAKLRVHESDDCAGGRCIIHRPSAHPLVNAPMVWGVLLGMSRLCAHGEEHPDRDDAVFRRAFLPEDLFEHDCDGCCLTARERTA
jgi:hypothetical protein